MKKVLLGSALAVMIVGCASSPDKIQTSYVSPMQYKNYDCDQIAGELGRISHRANELHGNLKKTADNDKAQMALGMVVFWPALFFLEGGDGPEAAEYGRLKGERDALEKAAIQKKCDAFITPKPAIPIKEAADGNKQQVSGVEE
ncbi:metal ABC transporter ATP-binding protein [Nitrosococcus wardiae]|uniref:Metal ABC transporter ATP-binding protein n=1 Tax=Nitrosococcus wardiae TaxID=1814290 RepID=A0A4P7BT82_9GAMM|nr:metal ABC transporter ATP-binding protein [Nitrosococcus wardiae]QBQ53073.1 metal ABC transporter ATP-binding protein [Nitrosococcus wardiae]QBQ56353.1 metal ABC transporter ATP-binding protein [Nitrosococcus wardiae]QBQ56371.1 metal ABC transporter ATP-binding protein [Nitrosococcus wardiae]